MTEIFHILNDFKLYVNILQQQKTTKHRKHTMLYVI